MHNRYVHILESGESMVSNTVIASIIFQLVVSVLVPIIVLVYFRKNIILIGKWSALVFLSLLDLPKFSKHRSTYLCVVIQQSLHF